MGLFFLKSQFFPSSPGPEVIDLLSCSTQLSMKFQKFISIKISRHLAFLGSDKPRMLFFPLINVKMPTIVGILTFMGRKRMESDASNWECQRSQELVTIICIRTEI